MYMLIKQYSIIDRSVIFLFTSTSWLNLLILHNYIICRTKNISLLQKIALLQDYISNQVLNS